MTSDDDDRLLAPYRGVRRVVAPDDGPWPGLLVRMSSGEAAVLVSTTDLPDEWSGWDASTTGHLLAPIDLVRSSDGHGALVPVCTERLDDFLRRRRDAGTPVSPGEAVTIGVSILRGLSELEGSAPSGGQTGDWWLTDTRRPVLAIGSSHQDARSASRAIVDELSAGAPDAVWEDLAAVIQRDRITQRDAARHEESLFAVATAEPLADAPLGRRRMHAVDTAPNPRSAREIGTTAQRDTPWADQLSRHVDADLADLFSKTTTGLWRRLRRRPERSRRAPWLLAAGVAALVVAGGLLWPGGEPESVAADAGATQGADETAGPEPETAPTALDAPPDESRDLASQVADLLTARTACGSDPACLSGYLLDASAEIMPGVIDLATDARLVTLVDEFGGVAVLRVDAVAGDLPSQLLVVQQDAEIWLLRDVYAAQQP